MLTIETVLLNLLNYLLSTVCHMRTQRVGYYGAGNFKAAQKNVLYLERGPERYALAWRVSSAFSTIDGEETYSTRSCECLHI